jgi:hypothetical protein
MSSVRRTTNWRNLLAWTVAGVLLLAGVAVALAIRNVGGWLAAALLAGVAAAVGGLVEATARQGLRAGRRVLGRAPAPVTVSVEYWQQPLAFVRNEAYSGMVRCGFAVLLVQTTAEQAVVLKRLRILIESREPGVRTGSDPPHAPLPLRRFLVDLDRDVPEAVPAQEGFPYTVSPYDPERFQVMAYTDRHDVGWRLALDWVCGERTGTVVVDDGGQPFRVSAVPTGSEPAGP